MSGRHNPFFVHAGQRIRDAEEARRAREANLDLYAGRALAGLEVCTGKAPSAPPEGVPLGVYAGPEACPDEALETWASAS